MKEISMIPPHHEDPRFEDGVVLFCCTSTDAQHTQLHSTAGDAISGRVAGPIPALQAIQALFNFKCSILYCLFVAIFAR